MTTTALWDHIDHALSWLDAANPRSDHEVAMRLMKITEEAGEVSAAYIGLMGQNPRKGVTHSLADLQGELCDVAVTALVALATVAGGVPSAKQVMAVYLEERGERLANLIEERRPERPGSTSVGDHPVTPA